VHFNDVPGQNVIIYWNYHPNTNVTQYKIWRIVKHNGVTGNPFLLATKNRGTTTYTDYDYVITRSYTDDLVWYDVRPYYSIEGTYADPNYLPIFGELLPKQSDSTAATVNEHISEFKVSCYPNPFNPSTKIQVIHPVTGNLTIRIYNLLGEEIKQIVNQVRPKGIYEFIWDGRNSENIQVNSGMYLVNIRTDIEVLSEKILLLK